MIELTNALDATLTLQLTMGWDVVPLNKSVQVEKLTRGGGVVAGKQALQPRTFTLWGSLYYGTAALNHVAYDEIKKFLQETPIEVNRYDDRNIIAYPTNFKMKGLDLDVELETSISFIAPDPLFYGIEVEEDELGIHDGTAFTLANDGTVNAKPSIYIKVATGSITGDLTITANGFPIEISGAFAALDEILIDCKNFTVQSRTPPAAYASIITDVGDDFLVDGFELIPESNSVTITATGVYTLDVTFTYRNVWL